MGSYAPSKLEVAARIVLALFCSRNIIWDNHHRIVEAHGITWSS